MNITNAFQTLSYGLLRNLSMSADASGTIVEASRNTVITHMNTALGRIYNRFNLKEKELVIQMYRHITNYHLDRKFAMMNDDRPVGNYPYILDLPAEPFMDDAAKILTVRDDLNRDRPLNDPDKCLAVFTPYPTTLNIPDPTEGRPIFVTYQALHPKLQFGVYDTELELPQLLEDAFFTMVAGLVLSDINTTESNGKAMEHYAAYDAACADIEKQGNASIDSIGSGAAKFHKRGFC